MDEAGGKHPPAVVAETPTSASIGDGQPGSAPPPPFTAVNPWVAIKNERNQNICKNIGWRIVEHIIYIQIKFIS